MRPFIVSLVLVLSTSLAHGTTIRYKNFEDLVDEADGIVVGTVQQIESLYGPNDLIYTFITFNQLEVLNGEYPQNELLIRIDGGQVGDIGQEIAGTPEFNLRDRVVLFLKGNGSFMVPFVGWGQGVFQIIQNPTMGAEIVTDYARNRIFGLKGNDFIKEQHLGDSIEIIPQPGGTLVPPPLPYFRAINSDGTESFPILPDLPANGPLTLAEFRQIIKLKAEERFKENGLIQSADPADLPGANGERQALTPKIISRD